MERRFDYYPFGSESRHWEWVDAVQAGGFTPAGTAEIQGGGGFDTDLTFLGARAATGRWRFGGKEIAGQRVGAEAAQSLTPGVIPAGTPAAAAGRPYLDFGARFYDPRTASWLSQDPLSEKYYPISPYAYCAGDPVNLVDPTGMDWYISAGGDLRWFDANDPEYVFEEETYYQIGASVSILQDDGSYLNYYQNYQIGNNTSDPENAEDLILGNPSLTGRLLSRDSQLPGFAKADLMAATIHRGQNDFLTHPITLGAVAGTVGVMLAAEGASLLLANRIGPGITRVFWSGGTSKEAMQFALNNQMTTLEMTRTGKFLEWLTAITSKEFTTPLWNIASRFYAEGAQGTAHVFLREGLRKGIGVWGTIESPILERNGVYVIQHIVPR